MINLPYSGPSDDVLARLGEGTHTVKITEVKLATTKSGEEKLLVTYATEDADFTDWLGFKSAPQSKRTFAYVCRLHELAGLEAPKNGSFNEAALVGTECQITLVSDGQYVNLSDFPSKPVDPDALF